MSSGVHSIITLPPNAAESLRRSLSLAADEKIRISYIPGPGDLETTYDYWRNGAFDPRVPSIAYSTMFFELCNALGDTEAQIITRASEPAEATRKGNFHFEPVPYALSGGKIGYFYSRHRYAMACIAALRRFKPQIAVIASDFDWQYLWLVKRLTGRIVLSVHNTRWPMGLKRFSVRQNLFKALYGEALRSVDAAVCTSHECERQVQQSAKQPLSSFVEIPQMVSPAARASNSVGPENILYLGRIEHAKGVFDLLEAFVGLRVRHPDVRVTFAGGGDGLDELKARVGASGLHQHIRILGHLSADNVHAEIGRAGLLVCPTRTSFNEGLAFVCFEAAAQGVPTIMSTVVPAQDLLEGACVVHEADSVSSLAAAIESVLENPNLHQQLSACAVEKSNATLDRTRSWGSQLYKAMIVAGESKNGGP